jgi:hypothetical protein
MKSFTQPADQQEILGRLQTLSPDEPASWGRMNATLMVEHLVESFKLPLKELAAAVPKHSVIRGPHGRWLALRSGLPWGKNMRTLPEIDMVARAPMNIDFPSEKAALIVLIDRFCLTPADALLDAHPLLGKFTREDWMRWGYLHADHHLRQFNS